MLNGMDIFSGIGGISLALGEWVRPIAYCEIERYAQGVLLSRMESGELPVAPIWDDIRTFPGNEFKGQIDIIFGGFPCQDISCAGAGAGLEGERSGLFFEIMRLVDEIGPRFLYLENVAVITFRGLETVAAEITKRGFYSRWITLSAAEIGANHRRDRWWLLAYTESSRLSRDGKIRCRSKHSRTGDSSKMEDSERERLEKQRDDSIQDTDSEHRRNLQRAENKRPTNHAANTSWWKTESSLGRVVDGLPFRVDRIKSLGNSVVSLQAETAFKKLIGLI